MAFDGTLMGIGEARLYALQSILISGLPMLNTILSRDAISKDIVTPNLTSACVVIGDTPKLWDATEGLLRFTINAGGVSQGLDIQTEYEFIDQSPTLGRRLSVKTTIACYLHPQAFRSADAFGQALNREISRERISDWARAGVLNTANNSIITLGSQEFATAPYYDTLIRCKATVSKGFFMKSVGNDVGLYGINIEHEAQIA